MYTFFFYPLIAFIANIILFLYIFVKGKTDRTNRLFSHFTLALSIWAIGDVLIFSSNSVSRALFFNHIPLIGACLTTVFLLHFSLSLTKNKLIENKKFIFLLYLPAFSFILINFTTNWINISAEQTWWGFNLVRGWLFVPYSFHLLFFVFTALYLCIRQYKKTAFLENKLQIKLLVIAILIPAIGGILTQVIPNMIGMSIMPMTSILTTFTALIIGYAILKHDLVHTKFFSVYNKLVASFLIIVLLAVVVGGLVTIQSRYILEESIGEGASIYAGQIMNQIDDTIVDRIEELQYQTNSYNKGLHTLIKKSNEEFQSIGSEEDIYNYISGKDKEWISSNNSTSFIQSLLNNNISKKFISLIDFYRESYNYSVFGEIFVTNRYGANIGLTQKTSDYYQADEEWWVKTKENGDYFGDVEYDNSSNIYSTTIGIRIDDSEGKFIGVLKAVWNIREIVDLLNNSLYSISHEYYTNYTAHLLNSQGKIIYSTGEFTFFQDKSNWLQLFQKKDDSSYVIIADEIYDLEQKLIAFDYSNIQQTADNTWLLTIDYNTADILNPVYNLRDLIILTTILVVITGLIISYIISRTISKPLIRLRDATEQISKGELDIPVSIDSKDEIGELSYSFQKMMTDLKQSRNELESYNRDLELKVQERTAELVQSKEEIEKKNFTLKFAQKELEEINRNLEEKVTERTKQIQKLLKQKDEFINQLGHDLKNPLGPLINLLPILEKHVESENDKDIIKVLLRNVKYMKNLVTKTLELARLNSPNTKLNIESFKLNDELKIIIEQNTYLFKEKNIKVINNISENIFIDADKLRFDELFTNLINNAVKYTNDKGVITIDAEEREGVIFFTISDNGIGMTADQLERLFDEFYKADESRHDFDSSGLGMPITKRIIEMHGGQIWAESDGLGMGSTFHFTFPTHTPSETL